MSHHIPSLKVTETINALLKKRSHLDEHRIFDFRREKLFAASEALVRRLRLPELLAPAFFRIFGKYPTDAGQLCVYDHLTAFRHEQRSHQHEAFRYKTLYILDGSQVEPEKFVTFLTQELQAWEINISRAAINLIDAEQRYFSGNVSNLLVDLYDADTRILVAECKRGKKFWEPAKEITNTHRFGWIKQTLEWYPLSFHSNADKFSERHQACRFWDVPAIAWLEICRMAGDAGLCMHPNDA